MTTSTPTPTNTLAATFAAIRRVVVAYPQDLLQARRAAFVAQVRERIEPDAVDLDTEPVTDWQDERNSRPLPY